MAFVETEAYGRQSLPQNANFRAFVGVWPADFSFPIHCHTGAVEIFYFPLGRCKFTDAQGKALIAGHGDLIYAPEGCPHFVEGTGEGAIPHFLLVAPNLDPGEHTYPPFKREHERLRLEAIGVVPGARVPETRGFRCEVVHLEPGQVSGPESFPGADQVIYVVKGRAGVRMGTTETTLDADRVQYIPPDTAHEIESLGAEPLLLLRSTMPNVEPAHT